MTLVVPGPNSPSSDSLPSPHPLQVVPKYLLDKLADSNPYFEVYLQSMTLNIEFSLCVVFAVLTGLELIGQIPP